jgi:hypothetical protein
LTFDVGPLCEPPSAPLPDPLEPLPEEPEPLLEPALWLAPAPEVPPWEEPVAGGETGVTAAAATAAD